MLSLMTLAGNLHRPARLTRFFGVYGHTDGSRPRAERNQLMAKRRKERKNVERRNKNAGGVLVGQQLWYGLGARIV